RDGGAPELALPYALLAGDYARSLYAAGEAEEHYRTAIQLADEVGDRASQAQALEKLGWLLWILARFDECAETLERATRVYQELGDAEGQIRAVGLLGMLLFTSAPLEGVRRITELLDRLGEQTLRPSSPLASLYTSLAMNLHIAGQYRRTVEITERAVEVAEKVGDTRMRTQAETARGTALATLGDLAVGRRVGEEAIPVAEANDDYFGQLLAVHNLGEICAAQGDFAASTRHYTRALELAERLGAKSRISAETANLAEIAFYQGDWLQAREQAERAVQITRGTSTGRAGSYFQYANVYRQLAMILAAQGDWERALPYLEESLALAERLPYPEAIRKGQRMLAERDLLLGRPRAALARLEPLMELATAQGSITRLVPPLALARAELGDLAGAERMLSEDIAHARAQGHHLALVDLLRVRGIVLARQDRREEALRSLDEAVALARDTTYPCAEARALYEQGRVHAEAGEEQAARQRFEAALAQFRRLGAQPNVERTTRALAALTRPRKASAAGG
ncbi:MAG TPA: tetratricopeptide repeat protein, partial [Ktedonobacterales bacterium]|nr:tetratricopeptide repeat protein [Ktedonobacterales bacterium]